MTVKPTNFVNALDHKVFWGFFFKTHFYLTPQVTYDH